MQLIIYGKPPSKSNNYHRGKNSFYKDCKVVQYEKDFSKQVPYIFKNKFCKKDRLAVNMSWCTDSYRADIDGILKVIFDCLQKNEVIVNDNKIDKIDVERFIDKKNPRVIINIWLK